jgi:hypothetical protein
MSTGCIPDQSTGLRNAAENAEAEQDEAAAALAWSEVFSFLMPLPPTQEVEVVEEVSGRAIMGASGN